MDQVFAHAVAAIIAIKLRYEAFDRACAATRRWLLALAETFDRLAQN